MTKQEIEEYIKRNGEGHYWWYSGQEWAVIYIYKQFEDRDYYRCKVNRYADVSADIETWVELMESVNKLVKVLNPDEIKVTVIGDYK